MPRRAPSRRGFQPRPVPLRSGLAASAFKAPEHTGPAAACEPATSSTKEIGRSSDVDTCVPEFMNAGRRAACPVHTSLALTWLLLIMQGQNYHDREGRCDVPILFSPFVVFFPRCWPSCDCEAEKKTRFSFHSQPQFCYCHAATALHAPFESFTHIQCFLVA